MARSLHVLILEDSPADAELMVDELRRSGFDPHWGRVEAREEYLAHLSPDPDVILADYTLPQFDAVEALRLLRERELDVPFIVVTDTAGEEAAVASLRHGADDYLLKDRLTRLGPAVEQALEGRRLRVERRAVEREARISARQWQATFDAISDPVFLLDAGGKITRCNEAAGTFAGERISALVGRPCWEVVHGASEPIDGSPYRKALRTQRTEAQIWQEDHRWFKAVVDPMLDDNGYLVGFVYVLEEITERKRTEQALRQRNQELTLLNRAGRKLSSSLELETVLGSILEEVRELLSVVGCSAWLRDPATDELVCRQATGPQSEGALDWRLAPGEGIVGWVVDQGESLIVPDAQRDERHFEGVDQETGLPIRSILGVPLWVEGDVIGALEAVDTEAGRFDARHKRLMEALAAFAANAIQNARLYEQAATEIRQRQRAEEAYRVVVEHALQGLIVVQDGRIAFANPRAAEITGHTVEELLALSPEQIGELIHQGDRSLVLDRLRRRLAGEFVPHRYTCRVVRKDGAVRWIELASNRITYEGRPAVQTSFMDITERKLAEERALFQARLLDAIGEAIMATDPEGALIYWNRAAEDLFGWAEEEVLGRNVMEVTPALDSEERATNVMERLKAGESWTGEFPLRRRDGTSFHALVTNTPVQDEEGNLTAIIGVSRDISGRKRAETSLREREETFRALAEHHPDVIARFDREARHLYVNPAISRYVDLTPEDFTGKTNRELGYPEELAEAWERVLDRVFDTGELQEFEFEFEGKRGGTVFHGRVAPEFDEEGRVKTAISAMRDVTERWRAEEEIRRRAEHLKAINDLTVDLMKAESTDGCFRLLAEKLKDISGALAVSVSSYDDHQEQLVVEHVTADSWLLSRASELLEQRITGWRIPVSDENRSRMLDEIITTAPDLADTTFGTVSKPVAKAIQKALGIDRFVGLALTDGDDLLGTAVLVFPPGQPAPSDEVLKTFGRVALSSLRQRQAEEALYRVNEERRVVLDLVPVGISITNEEGRIISANRMSEELLGISVAEHRERRYDAEEWDVVRPDGTPMPAEEYASVRALEDQRTVRNVEIGIVHPDDEITWISVSAAPVPLEGYGVAIAYNDVSVRKRTEQALRENEGFLRRVIDASPNCIYVKDWDGKYVLVNDAIANLYDTSKERMLGKTDRELAGLDRLRPEEAQRFLANDREVMSEGERKFIPEEPFTRADGMTRWFQTIKVPLTSGQSSARTLGVSVDITERKQAEKALEQRVSELTLLNDVGSEIAGELELDALLSHAVGLVRDAFGYYQVAVLTVDQDRDDLVVRAATGGFADLIPDGYRQTRDEGLIGWVATYGEPVLVNDVESDPRYLNRYPDRVLTRSELSVPICIGDQVVGVFDVQSDQKGAFDDEDVLVMETVADQIAVAMKNAQLYEAEHAAREQLRDLASYLQEAREEERTHIAREVHDEFGQMMTALKMDLSWLSKRLPSDRPQLQERAEAMSSVIDRSFQVVRRISSELRPGILDDLGLAAAIEWQAEAFCERSDVACQLHLDEAAEKLDRQVSTALFRIFQEALTNVGRHAEAGEVRIHLRVEPEEVTLIVADDGRSITPEEISGSGSLGLIGMRERARALGGEVTVEGVPGQGTTVTASIPYHE